MPTTNANGHDFFYADAEANDGAGISVVLLHGFPLDCRIWDNQMPGLSGRFRVITPDLRGFGKSGPPAVFSIESAADDMHALLRQIGALPCILGGLSMGGYVAQALAKK